MIICQGCGQGFDLPADYGRNKIQCPGCGVICAVPADAERAPARRAAAPAARAAKRAAEPSIDDQAAAMLKEPEPVPLFDDAPESPLPPAAPPPPKPTKKQGNLISCRRCGKMIRRQRECPSCDGTAEEADDGPAALELPPPAAIPQEDDSPYQFSEAELPTCPQCKKDMPRGAVVCTACGFDQRSRKKAVREFEPVDVSWDSDMTLATRLKWFGAAQAFHLLSILIWAGAGRDPTPFFVGWPFLTFLLCFVLGTFDRITLTRDRKGRTKIVKQWRAFFVPLQPVTTEVRGFEGITTGQWHDAGLLEWLILLGLCPLVVPVVIWWYVAIYKPHCHVALALHHGHSEVYIYRGRSEEQMTAIAEAVCNASGLRRVA